MKSEVADRLDSLAADLHEYALTPSGERGEAFLHHTAEELVRLAQMLYRADQAPEPGAAGHVASYRKQSGMFIADCSCGWWSSAFDYEDSAKAAGEVHVAEARAKQPPAGDAATGLPVVGFEAIGELHNLLEAVENHIASHGYEETRLGSAAGCARRWFDADPLKVAAYRAAPREEWRARVKQTPARWGSRFELDGRDWDCSQKCGGCGELGCFRGTGKCPDCEAAPREAPEVGTASEMGGNGAPDDDASIEHLWKAFDTWASCHEYRTSYALFHELVKLTANTAERVTELEDRPVYTGGLAR